MKNSKKEVARQHIFILFDNAVSNVRKDPKLAQKQALTARRICMRSVSYTHLRAHET